MKNKEKYDLRKLDFKVSYEITGCGKKIDPPKIVTITYDDKDITKPKKEYNSVIKYIFDWLEQDFNE